MIRWQWLRIAVLACVCTSALAQDIAPVQHEPGALNSGKARRAHYVVLVSLDGFRYDYAKLHRASNLLQMAQDGASTPDGMIPSYPTLTFPNHYTLVTGLYPEHHGIVSNKFLDPARGYEEYSYNGPSSKDGSWYGGTPLWVLAQKQGMRAATFFWAGADAKIDGMRPDYWVPFDDKYDDAKRVDQVVSWLKLPAAQRPHFITLYYSNVDHAAHDHGPDSPELDAAVHHLDALIGDLRQKLKATKLPVDLIVVSDHGGIAFKDRHWVELNKDADLSSVKPGPEAHMYGADDAASEKAYESLKALHDDRYEVYRRKDVPARLHFNSNPRIGDPVIIWKQAYPFRTMVDPARPKDTVIHDGPGEHGFDVATMPEMKASFYAEGPDIRRGVQLPSFENVNVYDFVCGLLGLKPAKNDGSPVVLKHARR
ncbi:alkaline phosphatase family protein [Terriglobus tenax]|uniref:alkaline phosphatase family protein n=1 Tax=Terriglobus tenax TaxID=1111115 RepID=UPI0021E0BC0F|nr:ectonucleotide pyrophosphatase/phosphodiesterase [Terriglobus tenax]